LGSARRIVVIGVSGNGKTTLAKHAAAKLGVPHVELDRLMHLPGWTEASDEQFRASVDEATRGDGWVTCGSYENKLGTFLYDRADEVVWLDQPLPLVLTRLLKRTLRDIVTRRDMFNGNRQTWSGAFGGRDSLFGYAIRMHFRRRKTWPPYYAQFPDLSVVRLRSPREVERWFDAQ
jgi:shikimate kinase